MKLVCSIQKPERLNAIATALKASAFANHLEWRLPTPVEDTRVSVSVERVHSQQHIKTIQRLAQRVVIWMEIRWFQRAVTM